MQRIMRAVKIWVWLLVLGASMAAVANPPAVVLPFSQGSPLDSVSAANGLTPGFGRTGMPPFYNTAVGNQFGGGFNNPWAYGPWFGCYYYYRWQFSRVDGGGANLMVLLDNVTGQSYVLQRAEDLPSGYLWQTIPRL